MGHRVQERIYERVSMPDNASFPTIFVQKAGEPDVVIVLDEGEFFDKTSAQAYSVGSRTERNLIHGQPTQHVRFFQPNVEALVRLHQAEDRMSRRLTDHHPVEQP